ncbi:MAG: GlcG/HbpS family heme-binding protein [Streptosporangiales bacterium]
MRQLQSVSLNEARQVIAGGEDKAREIGQPSNIAVVDAGGNVVAHIRMDGAWIGSVDIAINKAFTARAFDLSTADLADNAQPNAQFFGIHASNSGRVMIFAGGIPLQHDGQVVGAVGVSGGTGDQDQAVAESAAAAFRPGA